MSNFFKKAENEENILNDYKTLTQDGWKLSREVLSKTVKWVLTNPKYNYRDFYYQFSPDQDSGVTKLLYKLQVLQEMGKIKLPYKVYCKKFKFYDAF